MRNKPIKHIDSCWGAVFNGSCLVIYFVNILAYEITITKYHQLVKRFLVFFRKITLSFLGVLFFMELFDRVKEQAKKRGMTLQTLAERTDLSINSLYGWKNSMPSADKLKKVADYLGVSVDYLMGRDTSEMQKLDPEEDKLVVMFRKNTADMDDEEKQEFNESLDKLMSVAKDLFERDKKKK